MPSKMVVDRQKSCQAVEASVDTHEALIVGSLSTRLDPLLEEGEVPPDYALTLQLLRRYLALHRTQLVHADERHLDELADDAKPRRRREEAAAVVRADVLGLRSALDGGWGNDRGLELAGVENRILYDPVAVLRQGERVVGRMREPDFDLGPPRLPGFQFDVEAFLAVLETHCEELRQAVFDFDHEKREGEQTQFAKNQAMEDYNRAFTLTAGLLEAIYRFVGATGLASRVRPSGRRPGQRQEEVVAEEGGDVQESSSDVVAEPVN